MRLRSVRISQLLFLAVFVTLFVNTEYRGKEELSFAVNSFFRANPLVTISYLLSVKSMTWILLPGILMIAATVLLGRFFCGWICPLGTVLDFIPGWFRRKAPLSLLKSAFKYYLLIVLMTLALFNINVIGILDPIAIFLRFLTFSVYPIFGNTVKQGWTALYSLIGERRDHIQPVYDFLKNYILPFRDTFYPLAFTSFVLFGIILFLERYERRNWCRNLCPMGTLLGILGSVSVFRRIPRRLCGDCGDCKKHCPTSFDEEVLNKKDCILCMDCVVKCRMRRVSFSIGIDNELKTVNADRRVVTGGILSGFALSRLFVFRTEEANAKLIRPPGVTEEKDFVKKCVRCGECMKVCLRNALYPAMTEAGVLGIFTPYLIARKGYCEYLCTLCGQVCPTKAIPELTVEQKKKAVIGKAVFDRNHCLPYAKKTNCIVCEEHCPTDKKAIKLETVYEKDYSGRTVMLKRPYVVDELCVGCGICEYVCPLETKAGIDVFAKNTPRGASYGNT